MARCSHKFYLRNGRAFGHFLSESTAFALHVITSSDGDGVGGGGGRSKVFLGDAEVLISTTFCGIICLQGRTGNTRAGVNIISFCKAVCILFNCKNQITGSGFILDNHFSSNSQTLTGAAVYYRSSGIATVCHHQSTSTVNCKVTPALNAVVIISLKLISSCYCDCCDC